MGARRVAVTGAGVVSPLGKSLAEFHAALAEGRSGVRRLPESVTQGSGVQVGALVDWNPVPMLDLGVEVMYNKVLTGFGGPVTLAANGTVPAGPFTAKDQDVVSAVFRVQRNFLP